MNFGLLRSTDRGQSYRWICANAAGFRADGLTGKPLVLPSGALFWAHGYGVQVSRDKGCTMTGIPAFDSEWAQGAALSPDGGELFVVTGGLGRVPAGLYRSVDDGVTFEGAGLHFDAGVRLTSIATSADGESLYVGGYRADGGEGSTVLFRSDGGRFVFEELPGPMAPGAELWVSGVSPVDERLFFAVVPDVTTPDGARHQVYRTSNAGTSFELVLSALGVVRDIVVSADGGTVHVASVDGLYRSDNGGQSFVKRPLFDGNACATAHPDGLLLCAQNHGDAGFALGRESDAGLTVLLRLEHIEGPEACPPASEAGQVCGGLWPALQQQLLSLRAGGGVDAGLDAGVDGGTGRGPRGGSEEPEKPGCGCGGGGVAPLAFASALAFAGMRSRSRRPR